MTQTTNKHIDPEAAARTRGRAEGLAAAALGVGCIAFINLLGAEKAILAMTLGALALASGGGVAKGRAVSAIGLGCIYLVTLVVLLTLYHERLAALLRLLKELG